MVAKLAKKIHIEWTVGGAMTIDSTELWYGKWDYLDGEMDCWVQPHNLDKLQRVGDEKNGTGYFSVDGSFPRPEDSATGIKMTNGPLFRGVVPLNDLQVGDKILVMASAKVDQSWTNQNSNIKPQVDPQSHIVNARTDSNYHHESNGKHIQGRINWFSVPLTVVIGDFDESVGTRNGDSVNVVELNTRFGENSANRGGVTPSKSSSQKKPEKDQLWFPVKFWQILAGILLIGAVLFCCVKGFCSDSSDNRIKVKQSEDDYDEIGNFRGDHQQYSDRTDDEYGNDDDDSEDGIEIPKIT